MSESFYQNFKLGILGGGQLGRMLIQAGIDLNVQFSVLDPDEHAPCSSISSFTMGKLTDYENVLQFGLGCDLITIEIENVNTDALQQLVVLGKKVYPQPDIIHLIQDKRAQKNFFKTRNIPTAEFILTESRLDVISQKSFFAGSQ